MVEIALLIIAVLPFLVSLRGNGGVWQFLSLLFCGLAAWGALVSPIQFSFFAPWVIAWIFAGVALQSRPAQVVVAAPTQPPPISPRSAPASPPPPPPPAASQPKKQSPKAASQKSWTERAGADFSHGPISLFIMVFFITALLVYVVMK